MVLWSAKAVVGFLRLDNKTVIGWQSTLFSINLWVSTCQNRLEVHFALVARVGFAPRLRARPTSVASAFIKQTDGMCKAKIVDCGLIQMYALPVEDCAFDARGVVGWCAESISRVLAE